MGVLNRIGRHVRTRILAGVLIVTPLMITYLVLRTLFSAINDSVQPIAEQLFRQSVPGLGVVLLLILTYLAGVLGAHFFGQRVVRFFESLLLKIPIVKGVYGTAKKLLEGLAQPDAKAKDQFKRVVLVEYPQPGMRAVGFVTGTMEDERGEKLLSVFIPASPLPMSGMLEIVPAASVVETDWSVEEGIRMIVSGGSAGPEVIPYFKRES